MADTYSSPRDIPDIIDVVWKNPRAQDLHFDSSFLVTLEPSVVFDQVLVIADQLSMLTLSWFVSII